VWQAATLPGADRAVLRYEGPSLVVAEAAAQLLRLQGLQRTRSQEGLARSLRRALAVLDAGCGEGGGGAALRREGFGRVVGVDSAGAMVRRARDGGAYDQVLVGDVRPGATAPAAHAAVRDPPNATPPGAPVSSNASARASASAVLANSNSNNMPAPLFPSDSFDVVVAAELLQHLDPAASPSQLDEFARIVKPVSE
jgi:SAM-dependent methyltransferase